jgi:hypothetical protein
MSEHKQLLVIQCGEQTCASEPGRFCRFVRVTHFGTRWQCRFYEDRLYENSAGWLQRSEKCLAEFRDE